MIRKHNIQELRKKCFGTDLFSSEILDWIEGENLWNLWVPKAYGGLEMSLSEGLIKLQELARIDGSLGWTITLCSGANYFIGNLKPEVSEKIFLNLKKSVCFGGSGGVFGTAEKKGDHYLISGVWRYATGAPYLTHFTLNAILKENGQEVKRKDGSPEIRSFLIPREEVEIIEDWASMGLRATATHSFKVMNKAIHKNYSFTYDHFYLTHPIFKINFSLFADLTLWVNYLGMAEHFLEEASKLLNSEKTEILRSTISVATKNILIHVDKIETSLGSGTDLPEVNNEQIYEEAANSVRGISKSIIEIFPFLGVKPTRNDQPLNQVFRDYFTATQHHIFTK